MTVEEKIKELRLICGKHCNCSNCPIENVFPNHSCGRGRNYYVNSRYCVSADEVKKIYALLYTNESEEVIMIKISDVKIIIPNKVVEVTFMNGDKQKAVCQEPDVFSLEMAISICMTKHLLGGTSAYNKAVKSGIKIHEDKLEAEKAAKVEEDRVAKRRAKKAAYMKRKAEKKREEQIEIQKEAYIRALQEIEKVKAD